MFEYKFPAPINFHYPTALGGHSDGTAVTITANGGNIRFTMLADHIVRVTAVLGPDNDHNPSATRLDASESPMVELKHTSQGFSVSDGVYRTEWDRSSGRLRVLHASGVLVETLDFPFGVSGRRQMVLFRHGQDAPIYGLGEKAGGLDKAGRSYHFWNVDVVADHPHTFDKDQFDPTYISIPFLVSRGPAGYFGILLNNLYRSYIHAGLAWPTDAGFHPGLGLRDLDETVAAFGTEEGPMDLYILPGPTLADVVRRFARLTGRHELPPLWALGYHQCRWSYMSADELVDVHQRLSKAAIPVGAMWMDIDYMDEYRVFTYNKKTFTDEQRREAFARIRATGTRLVTIIDPGVKAEPGFGLHDTMIERRLFCSTAEGKPYIGIVWPGQTIFPDFSLAGMRELWADKTAAHLESGIDGIWNDMNDPSTGPIDHDDMLFQRGSEPHSAYHNQYANLMAEATVDGYRLYNPDMRPFVLTRSASTGIQRFAAVWTGDNASNPVQMALSIPMCLNLSLSGVSFCGPDVGGFAGDTTEELLVAWNLAGALFPFYRNHSSLHTRRQEPYEFSSSALDIIRKCVGTRAKLLPYIYNLFHLHTLHGDAVMRPLCYEFDGESRARVSDQFLLGPSLMAAPFVDLESRERDVVLPPGWWYDLREGTWIAGDRNISIQRDHRMALFVRDGAILPCVAGTEFHPQPDFSQVEFHGFFKESGGFTEYFEDDGESRAWEHGRFNLYRIAAAIEGGDLTLSVTTLQRNFGTARREFVFHLYGVHPCGATKTNARWPFGDHRAYTCNIRPG